MSNYYTALRFSIERVDDKFDSDEYKEFLSQIDDTNTDKKLLSKLIRSDVGCIGFSFLNKIKDEFMHRVSLTWPELTFKLQGEGEDRGDEWFDTWINGTKTESTDRHYRNDYIARRFEVEHPEIYERYIKERYEGNKKIMQLGNTKWEEDPTIVFNDDKITSLSTMLMLNKHFDQRIGRIFPAPKESIII